jgi:hypothetical protein
MWDLFLGDVPSAIVTFGLLRKEFGGNISSMLTIIIIFLATFTRLTRFLWIALIMLNAYGQRRARSLRLLRHLNTWASGIEYYIVLVGEEADRKKIT